MIGLEDAAPSEDVHPFTDKEFEITLIVRAHAQSPSSYFCERVTSSTSGNGSLLVSPKIILIRSSWSWT